MNLYQYNKVDNEILRTLEGIVGEQYVITDTEKMEQYSHDEVADEEYAHMPEVDGSRSPPPAQP